MDTAPEVIQLQPTPAIAIRARLAVTELPRFFGEAFRELAACGADQIAGPPFAVYHSFDPEHIDVAAVMPLRGDVEPRGRVERIELAGGPAVQVQHVGAYEELGATYESIEHWVDDHHSHKAGPVREVYLTPPTVPAAEQVTLVIQPIAT